MYRTLLPVVLCTAAVAAAPQVSSNTTVKTQPEHDKSAYRIFRIENDPTPGTATSTTEKEDEGQIDIDYPDSDSDRRVRSDDSTASYESETYTTTERDDELLRQTEEYESRTRAPAPRFISKLSYFNKDDVATSLSTNFVDGVVKRKFRSKCRCEKIWNCPKLQITVPRCPNEYFMCCF